MSQSQEHQQYITFLQRLLGPLLEAYSSAVIFVHNFSGPVLESEYIQKLHRHLISRTERNVAVYGMLNWFGTGSDSFCSFYHTVAPVELQFVYLWVFFLAAESATYSHVKNAVKVFKEIGVSVWCSNLVTVKFNFNNEHNLHISMNLFSVSLKLVNVSAEMYCGFGEFWFPSG